MEKRVLISYVDGYSAQRSVRQTSNINIFYVSVCKWVFDAYHRFSIGENWILFVTQPDFRMFIGLRYIFVFNKHFRNRWTMRRERFCTQTHMNAFHLKEKETEREGEKKRFLFQVSVKSEIKYLNFNYISRPAERA